MVLSKWLARSKFGLALFSIREDEEVARAFGVPTSLYKCLALVISSAPASLVGGIYVWNMTYISPQSVFGLEIALSPIVMAMLGGTGIMVGPSGGGCLHHAGAGVSLDQGALLPSDHVRDRPGVVGTVHAGRAGADPLDEALCSALGPGRSG